MQNDRLADKLAKARTRSAKRHAKAVRERAALASAASRYGLPPINHGSVAQRKRRANEARARALGLADPLLL